MSEGEKTRVLELIQKECGLPFQEEDILQEVKKEIESLAKRLYELNQVKINFEEQRQRYIILKLLFVVLSLCGVVVYFTGIYLLWLNVLYPTSVLLSFLGVFLLITVVLNYLYFYMRASKRFADLHQMYGSMREKWILDMKELSNRIRAVLKVDFLAVKEEARAKGFIVQKLRCRNCGAPIIIPESGSSVSCEYCRKEIKAFEILKEIRKME